MKLLWRRCDPGLVPVLPNQAVLDAEYVTVLLESDQLPRSECSKKPWKSPSRTALETAQNDRE